MAIRAILFDIGGVLEIAPSTRWVERWERELHLDAGEVEERLHDVFRAGTLGTITEAEVEQRIDAILHLGRARLDAFMADLWADYLGALNVPLAEYFRSLRPRYRTGILSTSFVGAREREHERYGFGDLCDLILYSHEEGMEKPDPRLFALATARLGVRPEEIVFLDDVLGHVKASCAFGMRGVLFTETAKAIADIDALLSIA